MYSELYLLNDSPTVDYQLTDTIRSKLFNYKTFVPSLDVDTFPSDNSDNSILPCDCSQSPFADPNHGHIISGDLGLVTNDKLHNLISKGTKYREPLPFSSEKAKNSIINGLDNCINSWCKKEGVPRATFMN